MVGAALRWVGGRYKIIAWPFVTSQYGNFYKSIDIFDFLSTKYSISRRTYRPWQYLWSFCVQAAIVNAYILYISTNSTPRSKSFTQCDFRLALAKGLLGSFSTRKYEPKIEPLFISPEGPNERFVNHQSTRMLVSRGKVCKTHMTWFGKMQHTVYDCLSCNVHLCKSCQLKWHSTK